MLYSKERGYFLHVPNQRISKAAVSYDWGDIPEGASIIVDIHSHNTMGAFFSGTDNNDDSSSIRISGVFGNLQNSTPSTVWRFNYLNQKFDLKLEDIFEEPKKEELELPKEWLSRVAVSTPTVYPINRYVGTGGKQARNTTTRGRGIGTIVHGLEEMEDITRPTARSTKGHSGKEYALSMDVESNTHVTPAQGDLAFDDLDDAGLWMFAGDPVARMVTQQNSFLYGQDAAAQAARRAAWEKAVGTSPENPQELESAEEAIEREAHIEDEVREVRRVHVVDGDDEGPPVGRGGLYEVHAIEYGTEIADAYDSIDTEMVMLEGQDELLGALSSDMVGLIKDDAVKLDLMRSLYNSIGSEGREKLMSTGF
ncbi:MAG TPA: Mov34/MPN/PAD-1 family protein [Methanosarcina sp.]|nr:Mov34/MPN/PAD-1 family protein [Methanosarcina sp.]